MACNRPLHKLVPLYLITLPILIVACASSTVTTLARIEVDDMVTISCFECIAPGWKEGIISRRVSEDGTVLQPMWDKRFEAVGLTPAQLRQNVIRYVVQRFQLENPRVMVIVNKADGRELTANGS